MISILCHFRNPLLRVCNWRHVLVYRNGFRTSAHQELSTSFENQRRKKISGNISSNIQDTCRKMIKLEKKKQKPTIQVEVVEMKIFRIFLEKDAMNLNSKKVKKKSFFYWRWVEKIVNCDWNLSNRHTHTYMKYPSIIRLWVVFNNWKNGGFLIQTMERYRRGELKWSAWVLDR